MMTHEGECNQEWVTTHLVPTRKARVSGALVCCEQCCKQETPCRIDCNSGRMGASSAVLYILQERSFIRGCWKEELYAGEMVQNLREENVFTERSCVPVMMVAMRHDAAPDPVSTRRSGRGAKYLRGSP